MRYLLLSTVICWLSTYALYKWSTNQGDNFASAIYALIMLVVSVVLSVAYIALAFWNHELL